MNSFGKLLIAMATLALLSCPLVSAQGQLFVTTVQTQTSSSSAGKPATADDAFHFDITPYLWFAGAHGTVGALGRDVSMHASPGDLLSHFDIGLMGAAEARKKRFVLNGDIMWIRLS